jgi:hypothetical protein
MSKTNTVSPLRQRMIEGRAARKLNPHARRSHIHSCKRFAGWLKRSPDTNAQQGRPFSALPDRKRCRHQSDHARPAVTVPRQLPRHDVSNSQGCAAGVISFQIVGRRRLMVSLAHKIFARREAG